MTKEEKPKSINFDSLSVILFVIMLIFALARVVVPGFLPLFIFQISLAAVALLTSFIYFQRARSLSVSYHTPFSDTLVILAGFYIMLVLLNPLINQESPALIWGVALVVIGIVGRLILLDSIIKALFSWSQQLFNALFGWIRGPYNLIRVILFIGGLFLINGSNFGVIFVLSVLLGYIFVSLSVLLTIRTQQQQPHFYLRVVGFIVAVYLAINALRHIDNLEIMSGSFLLALSLVPWIFGRQILNRIFLAINDLVIGFYNFIITSIRSIYNYISNNKLTLLRFISVVIGVILLVIGLVQGNYLLFVGLALIILAFVDYLYRSVRWGIISISHFIREKPRQTLQIVLIVGAVFALIFLPRENNLNLITALVLFVAGIGPTVYRPLGNFVRSMLQTVERLFSNTYNWLVYNFTNHPIGSLQVTSLIFAVLSLIFVPSTPLVGNFSLKIVVAVSFAVLAILPTVINWFVSILPGLKQVVHDLLVFFRKAITNILVFLRKAVKNSNAYYSVSLVISGYFSFTLPNDQIYLKIVVLFVFSLSLSLIGNGFLMGFYDGVHRGFVTVVAPTISFLVHSLIHLLRYKILASILAWGLLIMGVFNIFIPEPLVLGGFGRWLFILLAIVLWNTADADRRLKFRNFMTSVGKVVNPTFFFSVVAIVVLFIGVFGVFLPDNLKSLISVRVSLIMLSILIWNMANEKRRTAFIRALNQIARFFNVEVLLNIISWVLLIMGVFNIFIPEALTLGGFGRWLFILLAIIIFNTATAKRRARFFKILNTIISKMFENIFILGFFILGLGFLTISFGIIFQGTIGFVSDLFGQALDNPLVKWIIGLFMAGIGVVTIQQAFSRRADLQLSGGKAQ